MFTNNRYLVTEKMKYNKIVLGFGSNVGNKIENIEKAYQLLELDVKIKIIKKSHFYHTSPVGYNEQELFINSVAEIESDYEPIELLTIIKAVEKTMGRERDVVRWGPRIIDIDILFFDSVSLKTKLLEIPHKEIVNRKFVMIPLLEIEPDFVYPPTGIPLKQYLENLKNKDTVKKIETK